MARVESKPILGTISSFLKREQIASLARELGVVRRQRKVDIPSLVYAFVFSFEMGRHRTLNGARLAYEQATGQLLARSSFHDRLTPEFAELLRQLVEAGLAEECQRQPTLTGTFRPFEEVLAVDSCIITLHDTLSKAFPGSRHSAAAKVAVVTNIVERSPRSFLLEEGRTSDVHLFKGDGNIEGRLFIFDLGFYSERLFCRINRGRGFFLSRMRKHCNPRIVRVLDPSLQHLEGKKWKEVRDALAGTNVEFETEIVERDYATSSNTITTLRVIATYNENAERFHMYVTNAPPQLLEARHTTAVYAARWEIELLFRELKSDYRLGDLSSRNEHIIRALLYASILSLLVSRKLRRLLCPERLRTGIRASTDRWARLFANFAPQLLGLLGNATPRLQRRTLERILRREARDPNRRRLKLPQRAQNDCSFAH